MAEISADGILRHAILTMSSRRPHRPTSTNRTPENLPAPRWSQLVQTGAEATADDQTVAGGLVRVQGFWADVGEMHSEISNRIVSMASFAISVRQDDSVTWASKLRT